MGIGFGIFLIVVGAILLFALNVNIPYVSDDTVGIILLVAGALTLILAIVLQAQRGRTKHVQENRYDPAAPGLTRRAHNASRAARARCTKASCSLTCRRAARAS